MTNNYIAGALGQDWRFASAASGIVNTTTAVTLKAAITTNNLRNYITGLQLATDTLGAVTELVIRDGAGGTVLWRTKLQTTALPSSDIEFAIPLKGSVGNLLEIVTLTAVTGGVYVNAQGYEDR